MDVLALTKEFIRLDTVSSRSPVALASRLEELLLPLGFEIERHRVSDLPTPKLNLIARRAAQDGTLTGGLLLSGHMDTVPFESSQKAQLLPLQEGALLYGRGACDMKGGIAAMVDAAARACGRPLRAPLTLAFTCDEEVGCLGAKALLRDQRIRAQYAIIGEPTSLSPKHLHKGYYGARVTLTGRAAHSSDPGAGRSAIKAAMHALLALEAFETTLQKVGQGSDSHLFHPPYSTLNVGLIQGGTARNVVPEQVTFTVELRPLPGLDLKRLQSTIEALISRQAGSLDVQAKIEWTTTDAPMQTAVESPVVAALEQWSLQKSGAISFSTEGKEFNQLGMQSVIFGPGSIQKAHQEDECVPIEELGKASDAYEHAIQRFCLA